MWRASNERAQEANCPPSVVLFGLVHVLTKDTTMQSFYDGGPFFAPGTNPVYGATILLGEADAGIFIDPDSDTWGNYDDNWVLEGKVYGLFRGSSNGLVATVRATKPDYEVYPVQIDFTPLGPTNLT